MKKANFFMIIFVTVLGIFGGAGYFYGKIAENFTGKFEFPLTSELIWKKNNKIFAEENLSNISAKAIIIRNGAPLDQQIVLQRPNDYNIKKIFIGNTDITCSILKDKKVSGKFDSNELKIDALQLPDQSEIFMLLFSDNSPISSIGSSKTRFINKGKPIKGLLIFSYFETFLIGAIIFFVGLVSYRIFEPFISAAGSFVSKNIK
jgi:hypothetical protein